MAAKAATVHPNVGEEGIGESWARRSESFARDGFALSDGPVLPPDVVARARASFEAIVAKADAGAYPPEGSMTLPHVQGVVADLAEEDEGGEGGLRKVEMPQLDRSEDGIVELMNHPALAAWCAEATGADWLQCWWIQMHGKPPSERDLTTGDGTSIGYHQVRGCARYQAALCKLRLSSLSEQDKNYWFSSFDTVEEGDEPRESEIFTAWVALSDVGPDSGPMMLLRGSRESTNGLPRPLTNLLTLSANRPLVQRPHAHPGIFP